MNFSPDAMIPDPHPPLVYAAVIAGVHVRCNRLMTGLPVDGDADLELEVRFDPAAAGLHGPPAGAHALPESTNLAGWISADGRRASIADLPPGAQDIPAAIRRIVPYASALQGEIILHSSAVASAAGVHAFVGASGTGKSTLAAQLSMLGLPLVADELMPCRAIGDRVVVPMPGGFDPRAGTVSLRGIHFLSRSLDVECASFVPLAPAQSMVQLLWNGFGELASPDVWKPQFESYSRIARRVPAFALRVPDDRARIAAIAADVHRGVKKLDLRKGT